MWTVSWIRLIAVLSAWLLVGTISAQTTIDSRESTTTQPPSGSTPDCSVQATGGQTTDREQPTHFASALNGTGLIPLASATSKRLMVGASTSSGWDTNPNSQTSGASSAIYIVSPYVGIEASTPKTQYMFQYQPTITGFTSNAYRRQTLNEASLIILGNLSERWKWDMNASGSYGQDSIRLLAPPQTVAVGAVPGTTPNTSAYLSNAGMVTYLTGGAELNYRRSERDSIEFGATDTFGRYSSLKQSNSIASSRIEYGRELSPTLSMRTYGKTYYYYGALNCASFGAGVGLNWHLRDNASLTVNGGPQLNSSACGKQQGFAYSAALSARLSENSQVYVLTDREPTVSYLGPGLWLNSVSGGYQRQIGLRGTLSADLGYVNSDTLSASKSYHGTYFDCSYSRHLGRSLSTSYSYRAYVGDAGGSGFKRNVFLFSFGWAPSAGHFLQ
jgi:hypothetical protein